MSNPSPIRWGAHGVPYSLTFQDKYFCTQNGYAEYRHISGEGNRFAERWAALDPNRSGVFTVLETGFGTGMCFCCVWEMWEQCAPPSWTLHFISIEKYPLSVDEVGRALGVWPELGKYRDILVKMYQPQKGGVRDLWLVPDRVRLTIVFEDVVAALKRIYDDTISPKVVDACLLNGFSPFANPDMWSAGVFAGIARLSKPGTTVSTFTVAGHVRRGLEAAGFRPRKIPGFGTKKHMLSAEFISQPPEPLGSPEI